MSYTTGTPIPFKANPSNPVAAYNGPYTHTWTFDDATSGTGQYVEHQYTTAGNHQTKVSTYNTTTGETVEASIVDEVIAAGWRQLPVTPPRILYGALLTVLPSGRILISGGAATLSNPTEYLKTAYEFDGTSFTAVGDSGVGRANCPGGTLFAPSYRAMNRNMNGLVLGNGKVLFFGSTYDFSLKCELYDPSTKTWSYAADFPENLGGGTLTGQCLTDEGNALVFVDNGNHKAYLYTYSNNTWAEYHSESGATAWSLDAINIGSNNIAILLSDDPGDAKVLAKLTSGKVYSKVTGSDIATGGYYKEIHGVLANGYLWCYTPNSFPPGDHRFSKYNVSSGAYTEIADPVLGGKMILFNSRYLSGGGSTLYDIVAGAAISGVNHVSVNAGYMTVPVNWNNGVLVFGLGADGLAYPEVLYY